MLPPQTSQRTGWVLLTLVVVVAVLKFAQDVLMPVALAVLLAFLLAPVVDRLHRWGCNRGLAVTLTTVVTFVLVGAVLYVVVNQFLGLVEQLPLYRENLLDKIRMLSASASVGLERGAETVKDLTGELQKSAPGQQSAPDIAKVQIVEPPPNAAQVFRGVFGPLIAPAATAAIVVVFVIFMLLQREDLRDRLVRLLGTREMHTTVLALDDAAERVSRYLMMQILINGLQGAVVAVGLYLIGVPNAVLWGALTIVLRFIPYLGPVLAAIGPILLSIAFFHSWTPPLLTIGLILTLELITNNVLEPRLYGSSIGVSSLALIVATVFWTWLWGTVGLFLATPLTVCLVVMGKYIPQLEFLSVVLSDEPVLEPHERLYQRLLADDPVEAEDLIEEASETQTLLEICDVIVFPALRLVEQDHDRGAINDAKRRSILDQIGVLIDDLRDIGKHDDEDSFGEPVVSAGGVPLTVLCLPAADQADELAAGLFASALERRGIDARSVSVTTLKGEMLDLVDEAKPDAICISATPPAAVIHGRYLCKKLRSRFVDTPIVIGLWDAQGDMQKASDRLTSVGAEKVVTTAAAGVEEITRLLQPSIQGVQ
jgi:predicted PurR-regulated permease PerM